MTTNAMFAAAGSNNILAGGGAQLEAQHEAARTHEDQSAQSTQVTGTRHQSQDFDNTEGAHSVYQSYTWDR